MSKTMPKKEDDKIKQTNSPQKHFAMDGELSDVNSDR